MIYVPMTWVFLHISCFLFVLALFVGITILALPITNHLGMGSIETAVLVGLVCCHASIHILLPHCCWCSGYHGPKRPMINLKDLATDTHVVVDENEDRPSCDQDCHCCSICLGDLCGGESATRGRVCGHIFHEECLTMWVNKSATCPYCRQDLLLIDASTTKSLAPPFPWSITFAWYNL
jgi:hypothetical protein